MATALSEALNNLELAHAIATADASKLKCKRGDKHEPLPPSMIELPSGDVAYVATVTQKVVAAADGLRGLELRDEKFKTRLSSIAAAARSSDNPRTVASGYTMEEGMMLEILGDIAVQFYGDSDGGHGIWVA